MVGYDRSKKEHRDFFIKVGIPEGEYGREIAINARSSLEAGLIATITDVIPVGYVAHSLRDGLE